MKMFSDCSGPCETCANSEGCMAGHGDDDYVERTPETEARKKQRQEELAKRREQEQKTRTREQHEPETTRSPTTDHFPAV